jgi:electron transfer flavoprotein beta subunit
MSYGCDDAILLTDRVFGGSDTLATTLVISEGIKKISKEIAPVDLVMCGKQTIDGDTAQVGPGIARRLNYLQLTYVSKVDDFNPDTKEITVYRHLENGYQIVKGKIPAVLTVLGEHHAESLGIRRASLTQLIETAKFKPTIWTNEDLGIEKQNVGLKGSPTMVKKIFAPTAKKRGQMIEGKSAKEAAQAIIDELVKQELI